jgi:Tfp pilus tip-associated adhesin PilY1
MTRRYTIADHGQSITCHTCNLTSYNPNDVLNRFCARCGVFHDDVQGIGDILEKLNNSTNGETATMSDQGDNDNQPESSEPQEMRLEVLEKLTGDSIRMAVQHVTAHIRALVEEAKQEVAQLDSDAEGFISSLENIGNAHATRMEKALEHLRTIKDTVLRERDRVSLISQNFTKGE